MYMKKIKSWKKTLVAMLMMLVMSATGSNIMIARAATALQNVSIICYVRGNGRVNTYKAVNGAYSGYIDANDQCTILEIYNNGWLKVNYPIGNNKTKTAYTESSNFFVDTNFSTSRVKAGANYTVYKKSNLDSKLGSAYDSDSVFVVGKENGKQQIIYPISGNRYKMGFINGSISSKNNVVNTTVVSSSTIEELCFNHIYYADKYADLKAAFGYNKEQLLNHWKTYGIREGRSASPIFDPVYYLANNKDLSDAFKKDYMQAYNHFINWGYKELRASSPYYYGQLYRNNHADLRSFDSVALLTHYLNHGLYEKRQAGSKIFTGSYNNTTISNVTSNSSSIAQKIVEYALSQVGTGDYRGNNNVKYNEWYYNKVNFGSGYAWCMVFQAYCAKELGVLNKAIPYENNCADAVKWYQQRNQFHYSKSRGGNYTPKAGDLVFYYEKGRINHVGMITASPVNGYLQVVEGNVQCADGNWKVVHFTKNAKRSINNNYVYGYATPNY